MNFSKKPKKQHHSEKFQKSSILFTQLGLVLALFISFLALEYTTEKEIVMIDYDDIYTDEIYVASEIPKVIVKKTKVEIKEPAIKKLKPLIIVKMVPDDSDLASKILNLPKDTNPPISDLINAIPQAPEDLGEPEEELPFRIIEEAPIYPGCEGLDKENAKKCFTKKVAKFVNKKFNLNITENLNTTGRQRIFVKFTIDKEGNIVDILAKSPFKTLEKEAIRVVQKLPKMTPGKQRKKPVAVKYTLPITFYIE